MPTSDATHAFAAEPSLAPTINADTVHPYGLSVRTTIELQGAQAISLQLPSHSSTGQKWNNFETGLFSSSTAGFSSHRSEAFQAQGHDQSNTNSTLEKIVKESLQALIHFSKNEFLAEEMMLAFGENYDLASAKQFFQAIQTKGVAALPNIELVEGDSLNQAYGVYAKSTDTVYFSRQFLANGTEAEQVKVLLEEIGHSLDARINSQDTAGDEGELFSRIILKEDISALELARLKAEDDSAVLRIQGQILAVEQNGTPPAVGLTSGSTVAEALFNGQIYQTVRGNDHLIYTRTSSDRITWTNWSQSGGATLDNPALTVFNNQLYQLVRGGDNGIYQRFSSDGQTWSGWQQFGGGTLDAPEIGVFNNQLYQLVRGGDNGIYQRFSSNGQTWSGWQQFGGGTLDAPAMAVFNNQMYQTVRGGDNGIYQRFSSDGQTWSGWQQFGGGTFNTPAIGSFNNLLFQAVRGGDDRVYWRSSGNGQNWSSWQAFDGVAATGSPQLTHANGYLTATVLGDDGQLHSRHSSDGVTWTDWNAAPPTNAAPPANAVSPAPDTDSGFNIEFDYRFDTNGWFTAQRRAALEAAAEVWERIILDDFATTPVGTATPFVTNPQTGTYAGNNGIFITDTEIDDLVIFVGARALGGGTLGQGGASGYYTNEDRYVGDDFEPWLGSVAFNSNANWFFDATPATSDDIPSSQSDFISTAIHEIGHVLGFSSSIAAFKAHLNGADDFAGPNAMARNGGAAIPLQGSHIQDGYEFGDSGEAVLDPISFNGARQLPTILDIAIFDDIGYEVDYSQATSNRSENRSSGVTGDTGLNRRVAIAETSATELNAADSDGALTVSQHDRLVPACCSCISCETTPLSLAWVGEADLAQMIGV